MSARPYYFRSGCFRRGFTLVELIVVIGIIALVATLTLPAISKLTKGNGEKQAVNLISAYLSSARATAMNMRRPVALVFYEDPGNTNQTAIVLAQYKSTVGGVMLLDGIPGRPTEYLPRGVKVATFDDQAVGGGSQVGTGTGLNGNRSRVVMFDEIGHLKLTSPIGLDSFHMPTPPATYAPGQVIFDTTDKKVYVCIANAAAGPAASPNDWQLSAWSLNDLTTGNAVGFSSPGVMVYDSRDLDAQIENAGGTVNTASGQITGPAPGGSWPLFVSRWLQLHGDLIIVNSYTGNLIR